MWLPSEQPYRLFRRTPKRRALLFLVTALVLALAMNASAQTRTLRLASTPWSPFTNAPGKARFALDLVHTALGRIGINADTAIVDEGKLTPALLNGEYDGSAALWRDDDRQRAMIYSQPYLENRLVLVGRAGERCFGEELADLAGKKLALVEGYSYGDAIKNHEWSHLYSVFKRGR